MRAAPAGTSPTCARCSSTARSSARRSCRTRRASPTVSIEIMERNGVTVDAVRAIDHDIATGVWPDMTEHGWERDDWPAIFEQVMAADILVLLHADLAGREVVGLHAGHRAALRQLATCSTTPASTPTTAASAAASSPATRTASSTAR